MHETFMRRAISLAERGRGHTAPNPLVGAVIVLAAGAIAYLYLQSKKKQTAALRPDPDADYVDEDDEETYEFPEDDETN